MPLRDYGDFIIESGPKSRCDRLERLKEKALRWTRGSSQDLHTVYKVQALVVRTREHMCSRIYGQSKLPKQHSIWAPVGPRLGMLLGYMINWKSGDPK